jgi:hypothetical protein
MSRRNLVLSLGGMAAVALFFWALLHLIQLRYQRGDVFPASSTLRADPLGTRAFYEALPDAGKYDVSRGYVSLRRELAQKPATLFVLGLDAGDLDSFAPDEIDQINDYLTHGGRVVVTLTPANSSGEDDEKEKDKKTPVKKEASNDNHPPLAIPEPPGQPQTEQEKVEREEYRKEQEREQKADPDRYVPEKFHPSIQAVWGFGWTGPGEKKRDAKSDKNQDKTTGTDKTDADKNAPFVEYSRRGDVLAERTGLVPTEDKVPWKSPVSFLRMEPAWQTDYQAKGKPVLITRKWGEGEIIVASDSYFVSNEALRDDREPQLLAWIAGPSGLLLFDETHLGTQEQDGVMTLARRYRLEGYLWGLLVVAGLFLWRQSVPLVPPAPARLHDPAGGAVSGKDSRSGLVNLLHRNISPRELLSTCLAEWRRHASSGHSAAQATEMETVVTLADKVPAAQIVETYRRLCDLNTGGRTRKNYATQP